QELGKVARHRPGASAHELDLVAVAKDQRPEAVPLGLVLPVGAGREVVLGRRQHRLDVARDRQLHPGLSKSGSLLAQARRRSAACAISKSGSLLAQASKAGVGAWSRISAAGLTGHRYGITHHRRPQDIDKMGKTGHQDLVQKLMSWSHSV